MEDEPTEIGIRDKVGEEHGQVVAVFFFKVELLDEGVDVFDAVPVRHGPIMSMAQDAGAFVGGVEALDLVCQMVRGYEFWPAPGQEPIGRDAGAEGDL